MQSADEYTSFAVQLKAPQEKNLNLCESKKLWCIKKHQTIVTYQRSTDVKSDMDHKDTSAYLKESKGLLQRQE